MGVGPRMRCKQCGDIIQCERLHQMASCSCGALRIDALEESPEGRVRILAQRKVWEFVRDAPAEEP